MPMAGTHELQPDESCVPELRRNHRGHFLDNADPSLPEYIYLPFTVNVDESPKLIELTMSSMSLLCMEAGIIPSSAHAVVPQRGGKEKYEKTAF
mmetsp:Transcript_17394/g.48018  ORF Transcript_17394/g.48018 Transcript_17394/m.48018 type:complete len:94 (+) Transcript_17394:354-635(+)